MATLIIKNFPDELHTQLKELARAHHRSLAKQALTLLEQSVKNPGAMGVKQVPKPVKLSGQPLTIEDIERAIAAGRDS